MDQPQEFYGQEQPTEVNPSDYTETPQYRDEGAGANEPDAQQEPQQENSDILDRLASKGYDVSSFSNDEDLINETEARYAASNQNIKQLEEEQLRQQQYAQQQYAQNQQQQQALPEEESGPTKPEFDQSWVNLVEPGETGKYVVRDEYIGSVDPTIAEKVNEYVEWRQERSNRLIDDPVNAMMESGLADQIDARIRNAVNSELSRSQLQSNAADFISQNQDVLYVKDSTGNVLTDSQNKPVLSPTGEALNGAHTALREQGMHDPVARHQVAMQMVQNHFTQSRIASMNQQGTRQDAPPSQAESYKQQYTDQPFSQPTNPLPPGYMPNTPVQPDANAIGAYGLPEHNSLGSLATALAVHKGYLQQKS